MVATTLTPGFDDANRLLLIFALRADHCKLCLRSLLAKLCCPIAFVLGALRTTKVRLSWCQNFVALVPTSSFTGCQRKFHISTNSCDRSANFCCNRVVIRIDVHVNEVRDGVATTGSGRLALASRKLRFSEATLPRVLALLDVMLLARPGHGVAEIILCI